MVDHTPDEILMKRVKMRLRKGASTIHELCLATNRHPKCVRQALSDLMFYGDVVEHRDGRRYELAGGGGQTPGPMGGNAA